MTPLDELLAEARTLLDDADKVNFPWAYVFRRLVAVVECFKREPEGQFACEACKKTLEDANRLAKGET